MSNKAVSVYADALKRQQAEQTHSSFPPTTAPLDTGEQSRPLQAIIKEPPRQELPIHQVIHQERSPSRPIESRQKRGNDGSQAQNASIADSKLDSEQASVLSSYHDSTIEHLRKAVRFFGKEPFFGRFTPEEKGLLKELAYTYQRQGIKTTENEIARIAVNFLVNDYQTQGENSLLDRVLKAIHG